MYKVIIFIFCLTPFALKAQTDVLILKKSGKHVHTYIPGEELVMETVYRQWIAD